MSLLQVPIVEIGKWAKHPNGDHLAITHILEYPVIFRLGDFDTGMKAIYIPEESLVPNSAEFAFLWKDRIENNKEIRDTDRVVWARKLRGIFSMGLLIKVPESLKELPLGTDVREVLGISKYEQPEQVCLGGDNAKQEGWFVKFTEIENLRRYSKKLIPGEHIVATEKVHGSNARFCFHNGNFYIGSHHNVKINDGGNVWSKVAQKLDLETKLKRYPELMFFGEVFGTVQKGFGYDLKQADFILFDVFDLAQHKYLDWPHVYELSVSLNLKIVPVIYEGPWISIEHLEPMADGMTVVGNGKHIMEGIVIKTVPERFDQHFGRVTLKLVGQRYLLGKKNNA